MQTVVFLTLIVILLLVYYYRNYAAKSGEGFYGQCPCDPRFEISEQGLYEGNVIDHLSPGALNPFMFPYSAYPCNNMVRDAFKDDFDKLQKRQEAETNEAKKLKEMSNNSTTDHTELVD
ncbi:hypothetical protein D5b_00093 [Faustovirus]|nr:hypothetical protein D5b_00093 [Faustovirus]AMN84817.1 hypothetical protein D6_00417 [Faustovirus]AMP44051.1 hypothetical protein PRJ_Dakar_00092 [Faustovirus]QKE50499.1 hypothetical protein F-VV10_0379 [Faustovirus]